MHRHFFQRLITECFTAHLPISFYTYLHFKKAQRQSLRHATRKAFSELHPLHKPAYSSLKEHIFIPDLWPHRFKCLPAMIQSYSFDKLNDMQLRLPTNKALCPGQDLGLGSSTCPNKYGAIENKSSKVPRHIFISN